MLPVAVSSGAKRELEFYHNRFDALIIFNGIDADQFVPRRAFSSSRPLIIHAASDWRKGIDIIPKLQSKLPHFDFQFLNANIGEEPEKFARGDMFVHISCSEGNSYACLEAMSCDLPVVVTNVGLFESDVDSSIVGRVVPYVSTVDEICHAIKEVWEERRKFHPREWILRNATFEHFKHNWQNLIANLEQYGLKAMKN
jgi:glycosyltransferase involved in cell wall biosynthesis